MPDTKQLMVVVLLMITWGSSGELVSRMIRGGTAGKGEGILITENVRYRPTYMGGYFISPPNVYISNTWLVPGITGGYNARWCQRALYNSV